MTKLVARTELLQMFKLLTAKALDSYGLLQITIKLDSGKALTTEEAIHASRRYQQLSTITGGARATSASELHGRNTSALGSGVSSGGGEEVLPETQRVGGELLAGGEQMDNSETLGESGPGPITANDNPAQNQPTGILGAVRLATNTGFVVFVATVGVSGRVEIRCGQGLGLPGDNDIARVLEHGALIELDQLRRNLNVPE